MPKIPGYEGSQTVSTQQGFRVDPGQAGAPGRQMAAVGGAVKGLAGELADTQEIWDKAKVSNQYTTARNNRKAAMYDIMSRAKADPDHNNQEKYQQELADLRAQDIQIDDPDVKLQYGSETQLGVDMGNTDLNGIFRGKMVQHTRGEIVKDTDDAQQEYIEAAEVTSKGIYLRENIKGRYLERLKKYKEDGFITNEEYVGAVEDTDEWELDRAMTDAGKNPQAVLDNLDSYDLEKGQPDQVINLAKASLFRQQKLASITKLQTHNTKEAAFSETVLNDPETPMADKVVMLKTLRQKGDVSERYAINTLSLLTSKKAMSQENNAPIAGRIVRTMHDAMIAYIDENAIVSNREEKYLKKISEIRNTIMTTKELSMDERRKLENQLNTFTSKTTAEATADLKGAMTGPDTDRVLKYTAPIKHFENTLPDNTALHDEALRMYNYMLGDRDVDMNERKRIMDDVSRIIVNDKRNTVMNTWTAATKEFKEAGFAKGGSWHPAKHKDGSIRLVWMKDGKPITREGEIIPEGNPMVTRPVK